MSQLPSREHRWWVQFPPLRPLFSQQEEGQVEDNPKVAHSTSVYMSLSELSHMATPSCVSKAGKQSSGAAKTQVQLLRKMERMAIGASHGVLVITETGQNSKVKEVLRDRRQTQRGGSSKFTQARSRPMLGFRPNSKPSAQNWERDCKGVGVGIAFRRTLAFYILS